MAALSGEYVGVAGAGVAPALATVVTSQIVAL